jgi:hypothetical protein
MPQRIAPRLAPYKAAIRRDSALGPGCALAQARAAKAFTATHDAFWAAAPQLVGSHHIRESPV